jgi:predicted nucleotidyltransferase
MCVDNRSRFNYTHSMVSKIAPEKLAEYKRSARLREERRQHANFRRRQAAWVAARQAARILKEEFGATRVIVYGSLVHGLWFGPRSDIDLAAEAISPAEFWRAWCALDRIDCSFEINLVASESASESLRKAIEQEGIEL